MHVVRRIYISWKSNIAEKRMRINPLNESEQNVKNVYVGESRLNILITYIRTKNRVKFQFPFKILSENLRFNIMKLDCDAISNFFHPLFFLLSQTLLMFECYDENNLTGKA